MRLIAFAEPVVVGMRFVIDALDLLRSEEGLSIIVWLFVMLWMVVIDP